MSGRRVAALYFGAALRLGHRLHAPGSPQARSPSEFPGFPWNYAALDGGLLKKMGQLDVCDGEVVSVERAGWWAFVWWDRSGDTRPGSNSGLYAGGFGPAEDVEAFDYAKRAFAQVVKMQNFELQLKR